MVVAAGVLAGMAAPAQAQMVGAFQACYRNKPMPGGVGVSLNLVVVTPSKTMTGTSVVTQAVNPPLHVVLPVAGSYKQGPRRYIAQLESPMMPGYHIKMSLIFATNWKGATGTYDLWLDTPKGAKKGKVALRQTACTP
jgi:hypothetical protein